jgi:hypothetical protein
MHIVDSIATKLLYFRTHKGTLHGELLDMF